MSSCGFTFETTGFTDDPFKRAASVNGIRGHALAVMLSRALKARGFDVTDVYDEDHGWDFDVRLLGAQYHCACSIDDDDSPFEGHVTMDRSRSLVDRLRGRGTIGADDPVIAAVRAILEGSPDVRKLEQD